MLCQLRDYLKKSQTASMTQLVREFKIDAATLAPMLEIWVNKKVISVHHHPLACKKGCNSCNVNDNTYYCWEGRKQAK